MVSELYNNVKIPEEEKTTKNTIQDRIQSDIMKYKKIQMKAEMKKALVGGPESDNTSQI